MRSDGDGFSDQVTVPELEKGSSSKKWMNRLRQVIGGNTSVCETYGDHENGMAGGGVGRVRSGGLSRSRQINYKQYQKSQKGKQNVAP